MSSNKFSKDQLAIIYEAVKHMASFRDVLEKDNYIGTLSRDILEQIEEVESQVANPNYVSECILD